MQGLTPWPFRILLAWGFFLDARPFIISNNSSGIWIDARIAHFISVSLYFLNSPDNLPCFIPEYVEKLCTHEVTYPKLCSSQIKRGKGPIAHAAFLMYNDTC